MSFDVARVECWTIWDGMQMIPLLISCDLCFMNGIEFLIDGIVKLVYCDGMSTLWMRYQVGCLS